MNVHFVKPRSGYLQRKRIIALWMLFCTGFWLWGEGVGPDNVSRKKVVSMMKRVCDWQLAHPVEINSKAESAWARSAFYTGVMATYFTTGKKRFLRRAIRWAEGNRWGEAEAGRSDRIDVWPTTRPAATRIPRFFS